MVEQPEFFNHAFEQNKLVNSVFSKINGIFNLEKMQIKDAFTNLI